MLRRLRGQEETREQPEETRGQQEASNQPDQGHEGDTTESTRDAATQDEAKQATQDTNETTEEQAVDLREGQTAMADGESEGSTTASARDDLYGSAGMEVAAVLRAAHDASLEMTKRAEEEAARIRADAQEAAERTRREAEEEAARLRDEAREEEARRRRELDDEFDQARQGLEEERHRSLEEAEARARQEVERAHIQLKASLADFASEKVVEIRAAITRMDVEQRRLRDAIDGASTWVEQHLERHKGPQSETGDTTDTPSEHV